MLENNKIIDHLADDALSPINLAKFAVRGTDAEITANKDLRALNTKKTSHEVKNILDKDGWVQDRQH